MAYFITGVQLEHVGGLHFRSHPADCDRAPLIHILQPYDIGHALYLYYLPSLPQLESCPHQGGHVFVDGVALSVQETLSLIKLLFDGANAANNFRSGSIADNVKLLVHMFACPGHLLQLPDFPPFLDWLTLYETPDDCRLLRYVLEHHSSVFEDMELMDFNGASPYVLGLIVRNRQLHLNMLSLLELKLPWSMTDVFGAHVRVVPVEFQAALQHCSTSASLAPISSMVLFGFDFKSTMRVWQDVAGPETSALEEAARGIAQLDLALNKRLLVDAQMVDLNAGAPHLAEVVTMCLRREKVPHLRYFRLLASMGVHLHRIQLLSQLLNIGALQAVFVLLYVALRFGHQLKLPEFVADTTTPASPAPLFPQLAGVIGDMLARHGLICPDSYFAELERISGLKWPRSSLPSLQTLALVKVRKCVKRDRTLFTEASYKRDDLAAVAGEIHVKDDSLGIPFTTRAQINLADFMHRFRSILKSTGTTEYPDYADDVKLHSLII